jgi:uncharacterized protein YcaQ
VVLTLDNRTMRRLWLHTNGLLAMQNGPLDVMAIIEKLGFVQLDTIQNVSRAHHHILWSRHQKYREHMMDELLEAKGHIFEHFTHDASVLPVSMYPMWRRRFARMQAWREGSSYFNPKHVKDWKDDLLERITAEGPLSTKDFNSKKLSDEAWSRPPHKQVLEHLWYSGELATSHRQKFHKYYDLAERVVPDPIRATKLSDEEQIDWLCRAALERLSVATAKEIKEFWEAKDTAEVKTWMAANEAELVPVEWQTSEGDWVAAYAPADIEMRIKKLPAPSSRMKIINPFDPATRNRTRLKAMFGFDYKLEVFVPEAKRRWGYYVYPLLEGDKFVGRIEAKADRKAGCLNVLNLWAEDGVKWGAGRKEKLGAELLRFAGLAELKAVNWP